ncbi:hypothetical protein SAMN04487770_101419 [Butyrivibrio sp. ob235]|uniref:hypothetical protein n=1 Tax=Butyrivibrio sp. ob235 TaxID=1761780 RepID=UPI0008CB8015|nr:hypothetical protein [Butyrivibrio sp. ob235]SEK44645.1 hypothetical protein SAMN04487770_101419 [Butyrivibrio sp. ob235]
MYTTIMTNIITIICILIVAFSLIWISYMYRKSDSEKEQEKKLGEEDKKNDEN